MTTTQSGSQIVINQRSKATLHTFVSAENSFQVTSQIIETANGLVVVDAQFIPSLAEEVRDYAKQLGKPILRLFITHAHPDHFSGTKVFGQVPVYASQTTRDFIQTAGQAVIDQYNLGTEAVVPNHLVQPGEEVIDGLLYQYHLIQNAEAEEHLLILLPELGVIVAQDLIFNGVHLYLGTRQFLGWRKAVEELKGLTDYDLILAGHGLPASPQVYAEVNAYLEAAQQAFVGNPTAQSVKESLEKAFPDLGLVGLLHLGVDNAFARSA